MYVPPTMAHLNQSLLSRRSDAGVGLVQFLSITPWQAVPVVWLPVVALLELAAHHAGLSAPQQAACLGAGLLLWTLVEYSLHRFLFHQKTSRYW
jgi:dihydroceramide fatty acyl 2-hydroxylase